MKTITVSDKAWNAIQAYIYSVDTGYNLNRALTEGDAIELMMTFFALATDDLGGQADNYQHLLDAFLHMRLIGETRR